MTSDERNIWVAWLNISFHDCIWARNEKEKKNHYETSSCDSRQSETSYFPV